MSEPIKVTKAYGWMPVSAELAADVSGLDRLVAMALNGELPARPDIVAEPPRSYRLMVERADGVLAELLELHKPHQTYSHSADDWHCKGEPPSGYEWEYADWPCETVAIIAQHLGVEVDA